MKKATAILISFAALLFLAQPVTARTFYLKNGEEIDYQQSWKKNGRIYVLVNRDTLIDFAPEEVDMQKTYRHGAHEKKVKRHHGKRHKKVLKGHKKEMKRSSAGKSTPEKKTPESPASKKGMSTQPAMKAPANAQKKTPSPAPVKPGQPAKTPVQAPKAPVKNAPAGR